ncbi:MAG: methyl-accepting chemotaxis protein [Pseudomonadota bacterium]
MTKATPFDLSKMGLRPSVFLKCMAMVAVTGLTVAIILTVLNQSVLIETNRESVLRLGADATRSAAAANAGAMRFGNLEAVTAFGQQLLVNSEGRAVTFAAVDAAGNVVVALGEPGSAEVDIAGLGVTAIDAATRQSSRDGFWIAEPALVSGDVVGAIVTAWSDAVDRAEARTDRILALIATFATVLVMLLLSAWMLRKSVIRPLAGIDEALESMAVGGYNITVPYLVRRDEIGSIARNLDDLKEKLLAGVEAAEARSEDQRQQQIAVEQLSSALRELADGDLSVSLEGTLGQGYADVAADFDRTVETIITIIKAVVDSAHEISEKASEISVSSEDLSRRTENQAASLEETAASLDLITSNVRDSADGTSRVESIVQSARASARESDEVVKETVGAMSKIEESSSQISQIISVIEDIAFQTNLLALNAGVEAARAGEAGRGFAVVASEVRALAQRSSEAAKEITGLITQSTAQVAHGVKLVDRTGKELLSIIESVAEISNLMSDIATGTTEQSVSLEEINTGVTQLDQFTQQNAAMVEEAAEAGDGLRKRADELAARVSMFRLPGQNGAKPTARQAG